MASSSVPKVILKSTTKMSLNERFTEMMSNKQPVRVTIQTVVQPGQQQQEQEQEQEDQQQPRSSSLKHGSFLTRAISGNQKLAQQMESRPSVQAALTLKADSLKQRLGKSNIRSRLGWPFGSLARRAVGGLGGPSDGGSSHGGPSHRGSSREGGAQGERHGEWVSRYRQRGNRESQASGDQEPDQSQSASPQMSVRKRGIHRGFGWGGATSHGGVTTGRRRHGSNMVGRGQGLFGGGGPRPRVASQAPLTKEQLDSQLDAYMAKSRVHLDAELDTYMAQTDKESNR